MSVKICIRRTEHLREHFRLCFRNERFDQFIRHGDIDPDRSRDLPGGISCRHNDFLTFENIFLCDHLTKFSFYLAQLLYGLSCIELRPLPSRGSVISESRYKRIGMSVGRAPACADHFLAEIWIDLPHLVSVDHVHFKAACGRPVCQALEDLQMSVRLAEP